MEWLFCFDRGRDLFGEIGDKINWVVVSMEFKCSVDRKSFDAYVATTFYNVLEDNSRVTDSILGNIIFLL